MSFEPSSILTNLFIITSIRIYKNSYIFLTIFDRQRADASVKGMVVYCRTSAHFPNSSSHLKSMIPPIITAMPNSLVHANPAFVVPNSTKQ